MTPLDILRFARRWWWILLISPIIFAAGAYAASDAMTPVYQAKLTLVIQEQPTSSDSSYSDILASERRTRTYSRLATARPVLEETVNRLGLPFSADDLSGDVSVAPITDTQLITVAVKDTDPELAASIANTIGEVFIESIAAQQRTATGDSQAELQRSIDEVKVDIDETSAAIDALRQQPDANSSSVQAEIANLQIQLGQLQTTYGTLLESQQRMEITQSQAGQTVRVVEQATAPSSPVSPRIKLNTALGGMLGLVVAAGLMLVLGYRDDTVKSPEDIARVAGAASLGTIPVLRDNDSLETIQAPRSPASESFRGLRTNLQFASFGRELRSLAVTSSRPGDGKTTTIANLAVVLAQGGQRVIIVDGDLRRPRLHRLFPGITNRTGLTNLLLSERKQVEQMLQDSVVPGLRVLTTGPLPPNPPDLLNSAAMQEIVALLEQHADIVLIDSPPMVLSDAMITASLVDGMLLVATGGRTRSKELAAAAEDIRRSGTPLIGVVVNRIAGEQRAYEYYRSYFDPSIETLPSGDGDAHAGRKPRRGFPFGLRRRAQPR